jgi:hypothetical protein
VQTLQHDQRLVVVVVVVVVAGWCGVRRQVCGGGITICENPTIQTKHSIAAYP